MNLQIGRDVSVFDEIRRACGHPRPEQTSGAEQVADITFANSESLCGLGECEIDDHFRESTARA
jgi:hypothetical protein